MGAGGGYPEVEKLLLLSSKLNISLDSLMSEEIAQNNNSENQKVTGTIIISSPNENVIATCYKVMSSGKMKRERSLRNTLCFVSAMEAHRSGESRPFFWDGMPAMIYFQKRSVKYKRLLCREFLRMN